MKQYTALMITGTLLSLSHLVATPALAEENNLLSEPGHAVSAPDKPSLPDKTPSSSEVGSSQSKALPTTQTGQAAATEQTQSLTTTPSNQ